MNSTLHNLLEQAKEMKSQLDLLRPISPEQEKRIMDKFRLDWNYHSNHIEGNSYTYGETKMLILHGITSGGKPLKDGLEIKGHNEALLWILDVVKGEYPLTEVFIRELNKKILGDPYELNAITPEGLPTKRGIIPGQYKTAPNHVITKTGETFRFAEPFETPAKMEDLINWFRGEKDKKDIDPILVAIEFHYRFIRIHPFDDGNGRTARILMNFILMQYGYPPAIIKTDEKEGYYSALRQADTGDLLAFFEYITRDVIHSLDIMLRGANGESIDDEDDIDKEIGLLKGEMQANKKQIFLSKKEKVQHLLVQEILPLVQNIYDSLLGFQDFYNYPIHTFCIFNNTARKGFNLFEKITDTAKIYPQETLTGGDIFLPEKVEVHYNNNIHTILFGIKFIGLNTISDKINQEYIVNVKVIVYRENYFELIIDRFDGKDTLEFLNINKIYIEQFSQSEIAKMIKNIKKDHLEFIKSHKN